MRSLLVNVTAHAKFEMPSFTPFQRYDWRPKI